jgi:hypothetical protein
MEKSDLNTINQTIQDSIDEASTNSGPSSRNANQDPLSVHSGPSSRNISSNNGPIFMSSRNQRTQKKKKSTSGKTHDSKIRRQDKKIVVKPISKKKEHMTDVSTNYGPSSRDPDPFQYDDIFSNNGPSSRDPDPFLYDDIFSNNGPSSRDPDPFLYDDIFSNNGPSSSSGFSSRDMQPISSMHPWSRFRPVDMRPISSNNASSSRDMYKQNTTGHTLPWITQKLSKDQLLQQNLDRQINQFWKHQENTRITTKKLEKLEQVKKNNEKHNEKKKEQNIRQLTPIITELTEDSKANYQITTRKKHTKIDQDHVPIDDDGIKILANYISGTKRQIRSIALPDNNITDDGVMMLVDSLQEQQRFIRKVNLKNNFFNDKGVSVLATFLKNAHLLRELDLTDNPIGIQGIRSLLDLAKANISLLNLKFNVYVDNKEEDICPVCHESDFVDPVVVNCCGKTFCRECIVKCLRFRGKCPTCSTENINFTQKRRNLRKGFFDSSNRQFLRNFPEVTFQHLSKQINFRLAYDILDGKRQKTLIELFAQIKFNVDFQDFYNDNKIGKRNNHIAEYAPSEDKIISFYLERQRDYPNLDTDLMSKLKQWIETKTHKSIQVIEKARNMKTIGTVMEKHPIFENEENKKKILKTLKSDDELIIVMIPTSRIHVLKELKKGTYKISYYYVQIKRIFTDYSNGDDLASEIWKKYYDENLKIFGIDRNPYFPEYLSLIWAL